MSDKPVLYGFDGSTYVRTVRTLMEAKGMDYEQVPLNVLEGEPREVEHLERHPFGKVPVVDIDGMRLLETSAICRYIDETRDGPSFTPRDAKDRARMNQAICLFDSYVYPALLTAIGFHLFPDLAGNPGELEQRAGMERAKRGLDLIWEKKGDSQWLAGESVSLADLHVAPFMLYVSASPEKETLLTGEVQEWWQRVGSIESFKTTEPDLG